MCSQKSSWQTRGELRAQARTTLHSTERKDATPSASEHAFCKLFRDSNFKNLIMPHQKCIWKRINWSFIGYICSALAYVAPEGDAEHSGNVK